MLLECEYAVKGKKMHKYITDGLSGSDRNNSDEEISNKESSNEENFNEEN